MFDGDIIITDPCYIIRNENGITKNDWHYCEYGEYMERLGIKNYLTHDTIYGDWGCTVFDSDTKKPLGRFCADAGLVSVFLLHEVLAYNPNFNYHLERPWTTTIIPDFKGTIQIEVVRETGTYFPGYSDISFLLALLILTANIFLTLTIIGSFVWNNLSNGASTSPEIACFLRLKFSPILVCHWTRLRSQFADRFPHGA